jgi:hypothetical protein
LASKSRARFPFIVLVTLAAAVSVAGSGIARAPGAARRPPLCRPGDDALQVTGRLGPGSENTYKLVPFRVARGTTRVEVGYGYSGEGTGDTVLDLGLWDEDGYRAVAGFRGWSGSRHGNLDEGERPIFVQRDSATRNFNHGRVRPGRWHVELGVGAMSSEGARWRVRIKCRSPQVGPRPRADPVDPTQIARTEPGWYHGDFHMHAFHSNRNGPTQAEFVSFARAAGLDFMPITEYVINRHWKEWGSTSRANPDLLFWPGREVITYFGHAIVIGETPSVVDYRHGFEDMTLGEIQSKSVGDGALFGIAHPTFFPPPLDDLCRGCYFELSDEIDWTQVDTVEILTGPMIVDNGLPNPFVPTAIEFWEDRLEQGYKVTAVSGSDDKLGPGLGSSATAVYADELSRTALTEAIRAGHAYIRTLGVDESPSLDVIATSGDQTGMFGDTLHTNTAEVTVTVRDGDGQAIRIYRDGVLAGTVPIVGDDFSHIFTATRDLGSGPLGTFYRIETFNGEVQTTIANPIFLAHAPGGVEQTAD